MLGLVIIPPVLEGVRSSSESARATEGQRTRQPAGKVTKQQHHDHQKYGGQDGGQDHVKSNLSHGVSGRLAALNDPAGAAAASG